jgi:hypothetical protein
MALSGSPSARNDNHFGDSFLLGLVPHQRVFVVSSEPERDYLRRFPLDVARPYVTLSQDKVMIV